MRGLFDAEIVQDRGSNVYALGQGIPSLPGMAYGGIPQEEGRVGNLLLAGHIVLGANAGLPQKISVIRVHH